MMTKIDSLSEDQLQTFKKKGWIGPLDTFSVSELELVRDYLKHNGQIKEINNERFIEFYNEFFSYKTTRDHHLSYEPLLALFRDQRILRRLHQLGEPNLLLWRSNIFCNLPGQQGIGWHQAFDYYGHEVDQEVSESRKTLSFPKGEKILDLTVWLAIEDATLENGCVYFANGSHTKKFRTYKVPSNQGAFSALTNEKMKWQPERYFSKKFDFKEDEWTIEAVPAKAGQIIIFTERVMHRGAPNYSDQLRVGVNARYIRPSVKIYPHREHGEYIDGTGNNIEKHFSVLVSGRDDYGINVLSYSAAIVN